MSEAFLMLDPQKQSASTASQGADETNRKAANNSFGPPAIALPKGGGAIKGIGEKFSANPVTGTGSLNVPVFTSPGRSGFGPQLALSYDSGDGNGLFGSGWSLSLPQITRKTDKGLPKYQDLDDSDVFILSGAEDLVPVLENGAANWTRVTFDRVLNGSNYTVQRYRPRIEGLFARIERWTNKLDRSDTFWRSISKENVTTWYGKTEESRIADPADSSRIFSWSICESYDDKGNVVFYRYKREDSTGIELTQAHEAHRTVTTRSTNRYLKRVLYGNATPRQTGEDLTQRSDWLFELVFDYGEHDLNSRDETGVWLSRTDPFSSYRAGYEIRTYRLCQRVLMFHHFPDEENVGYDCLVRSTDFRYADQQNNARALASFINAVTQTGYRRQADRSYFSRSLPPLEFEYSQATINETVLEVESSSLENLPAGLNGSASEWIDLDGEGVSGILTKQAGGWFYKRNLSPLNLTPPDALVTFAPLQSVGSLPSLSSRSGKQQFIDLAGDGLLDLVELDPAHPGFYERTNDNDWSPFISFDSFPNIDWDDPNLRFVDLTGDGHSDVLITEDHCFVWYPSLAESGFAAAKHAAQSFNEEIGPALVFADGTESIYLADLSGDGMSDLVRIRNGEICYWPNLGYGRFGAKVLMDHAPWFEEPDMFEQRRIRLADIDGSGATDIIYLGRDGVDLYFNQSGNAWSEAHRLSSFPQVDDLSTITVVDLLGNGTACLVWSSSLVADIGRSMRYVDLMGGQKPHLLIRSFNNLGAETLVHYAPSTKFYLQDQQAGRPWVTRLPFPVHVVEKLETYDHLSRNRQVTRYAYHHGYFDGDEREFRGFGLVEQWDTEEFSVFTSSQAFPTATNAELASHVPPVLTRTWFHTGVYVGADHISNFFSGLSGDGETGEYYREPGLSEDEIRALLLDDTVLPVGLTGEEEREACRALKGSMLRQEIYALDGSDKQSIPYVVTEQNFALQRLQPRMGQRHAVFFKHGREALNYNYERNPLDPRITHSLTLEVDEFGNVLKSAAIAYGRRQSDPELSPVEAIRQTTTLITYTENRFTNVIDASDDNYRTPLGCETSNYELTGYLPSGTNNRYQSADFVSPTASRVTAIFDSGLSYEERPTTGRQRRLIKRSRTHYRANDLSRCLPLGQLESLALSCEVYELAFTPGLLNTVYQRSRTNQPVENLLPNPAPTLGGQAADQGGYVDLDGDGHWWIPSGRIFLAPNDVMPAVELAEARQHFFFPRRFTDPFGQSALVDYRYDLSVIRTSDALGNTVEARFDYRTLQPGLVIDPNGNRSAVAFDVLGMVAGTAVMGKAGENVGDSLAGFVEDLTPSQTEAFFNTDDPRLPGIDLLGNATTRTVYDLDHFQSTCAAHPDDPTQWLPVYSALLARETHVTDSLPGNGSRVQLSFTYSDGFGREIQRKAQAEPGPLVAGGPIVYPRWVATGWTIFNNKGKPVRQYEPFFSQFPTGGHRFEFGVMVGVSSVLFYDPLGRSVAAVHPNHTYEKVLFNPWQQITWDVNDTVLLDPGSDADTSGFTANYFSLLKESQPDWLTWYSERTSGALGPVEQDAAAKTVPHAGTPSLVHLDPLGRSFLTVADNGAAQKYKTRLNLDIQGNQREIIDPRDRIVMRCDYDVPGNRIHQSGMDSAQRWSINDVAGRPLRSWDSRGHFFRTEYDHLRRPVNQWVRGTDATHSDPRTLDLDLLFERIEYGEDQPDASALNLRTRVFRQYDGAGITTNVGTNSITDQTEAYNFKSNLLRGSRQLVLDYSTAPDWSTTVQLQQEIFENGAGYDALNRVLTLTVPDGSIVRPGYNEANLLNSVEVDLPNTLVATPFITNIEYNARGQRTQIDYANGARTTYEYDPLSFRLTRLQTLRGTETLQGLSYTYDPVGNITQIRDSAQQTIYFRNQRIEPLNNYSYDALYRLVEAFGREHLGQSSSGTPFLSMPSYNDARRSGLLHPSDGRAMGAYRQQYLYDEVGNFLEMTHRGTDPMSPGWTRAYNYAESSLLEPGVFSNRLSNTTVGRDLDQAETENYGHDVQGNMIAMPHLQEMTWNFKDQLLMTRRQALNDADEEGVLRHGERTYYLYDSGGQRVRKVTELALGQVRDERIYLGEFEIYRRSGANLLERTTLHVMDDADRIALVESRTRGNDGSPAQLIRFQLSNHLGSVNLELDDHSQIISYEEYYPYGSTSYRASRSQNEAPNRYRYTNKERDEESAFYYFGARYYPPWLGRWINRDPLEAESVLLNSYVGFRDKPTVFKDPNGMADFDFNEFDFGVEDVVKDFPGYWKAKTVASGEDLKSLYLEILEHLDDPDVEVRFHFDNIGPDTFIDQVNDVIDDIERGTPFEEILENAAKNERLTAAEFAIIVNHTNEAGESLTGRNVTFLLEGERTTAKEFLGRSAKSFRSPETVKALGKARSKAISGGGGPKRGGGGGGGESGNSRSKRAVEEAAEEGIESGNGKALRESAEETLEEAGSSKRVVREVVEEGAETLAHTVLRRSLMAIPLIDLAYQQYDYENTAYTGYRAFDAFLNLTIAEIWEIPIAGGTLLLAPGVYLWEQAARPYLEFQLERIKHPVRPYRPY